MKSETVCNFNATYVFWYLWKHTWVFIIFIIHKNVLCIWFSHDSAYFITFLCRFAFLSICLCCSFCSCNTLFFFLMRVYKELISFHKELAFVSKHRGDIFVVGSMDFEQYICFHAINSETKSQFFSQVGWMDLNWTREKKDCCAICYSWPTSLNWSNRDVVKTRLFP